MRLATIFGGVDSSTKMLLSRFSWSIDSKKVSFFGFTINKAYRAILDANGPHEFSAIARWDKALNIRIAPFWKPMIAYVNDPILNNKTKEKVYKIVTRAIPVGRKFDNPKSNVSPNCAFCNEYEDELHCFIGCSHAQRLWSWVAHLLSHVCPWIANISDNELLFGFISPYKVRQKQDLLRVWKVVHAETIRVIWYARCRKHFDNQSSHLLELKGLIKYRVQTTFSIFAASRWSNASAIKAWKSAFPESVTQNSRTILNIPLE